ncbi:hypothetical protein PT974_07266 [Cladobotryum mycophilum]|uniref:Uncharacterized protein n=1 Tax=Cladobotryum mycophilum TaxID=491253 RepID=A0ABR0SP65_9HYPO
MPEKNQPEKGSAPTDHVEREFNEHEYYELLERIVKRVDRLTAMIESLHVYQEELERAWWQAEPQIRQLLKDAGWNDELVEQGVRQLSLILVGENGLTCELVRNHPAETKALQEIMQRLLDNLDIETISADGKNKQMQKGGGEGSK